MYKYLAARAAFVHYNITLLLLTSASVKTLQNWRSDWVYTCAM